MSIEDSDYIFSVKGDSATDQNLATLVAALQNRGFVAQARPGLGSSVLVFARLTAKKYAELLQSDVQKSHKFGVTAKDDTPADRLRLIYSYLTGPTKSTGPEDAPITPGKGQWKFVDSVLPNSAFLADKSVSQLGKKAALSASLSSASFVKTHGTQVALYFEFLKFYILALGGLSVFGVVAYVKSKNYSLTYSFVNLIWGITFVLLWKRKERYLTNLWGVQNAHKVNEYDSEVSAISAASSGKESASHLKEHRGGKRFLRELAFAPIALLFVAVLVSYQLACFVLEIFLSEIYDGPGKVLLTLVPTVLISVFVPILTIIYNFVADKFLAWEGHSNSDTRYDSFVVKTFTLNFLTGYVPLLITSFIYLPFAHFIKPELPVIKNLVVSNIHHDRYAYQLLSKIKSQNEFTVNQARLDGQFFFFIVTNQIISFILKYGLPLVLPKVLKLVLTKVLGKKEDSIPVDKPEEKEWLTSVRQYIQLPEQNVHDDYRGLCLQFGYLSMFGPVWTLAPLLSLVFNVITFKLDTLKVTNGKYFRPPVPKRVDSIHPWDLAFFSLAWLGSIISPAVTAFYRHGTQPPKSLGRFAMDKASVNVSSSTLLWLTLFASEHLFFGIYFIGTKALSFLQSDEEIENAVVQHNSKSEDSEKISQVSALADKTADWKTLSIEEIKEQAKGSGKTESVEKGTSSGVDITGSEASENVQSLSNRGNKLEELERKKAQLERVKETLQKKQLEAQAEKGDTVISTIDAQGNKIQAIIDGEQHISMSDVDALQKKLSEPAKKPAKTSEKTPEVSKSEGSSKEASEESSSSEKSQKKKHLKKFLKRG
ncbi:hypothetical protein JCM33374_g4591 [Metschnikowia sp. JCM 33374]|nr:hypothetical protein JCM33374_g4591 [Metschnikowia sp. JCM 33374]